MARSGPGTATENWNFRVRPDFDRPSRTLEKRGHKTRRALNRLPPIQGPLLVLASED
jgi:hypothetical protein